MSRLPNSEKAIIETEKLRGYILSSSHPVGRFKAAVFRKLGYSSDSWDMFEKCLRDLILVQDVANTEESTFGRKYVVEGLVKGISGKTMHIVTVWVILKGENVPRLITAYPGGSH